MPDSLFETDRLEKMDVCADEPCRVRALEFRMTKLLVVGAGNAGFRCGTHVDGAFGQARYDLQSVRERLGILVNDECRIDGEGIGVDRSHEDRGRRSVRRRNSAEWTRSQGCPETGGNEVIANGLCVERRQFVGPEGLEVDRIVTVEANDD